MAKRAKSVCRRPGCGKLINSPGYCEDHKREENSFKTLDNKKTDVTKKFYSSYKWTQTSKRFRKKNPLCEQCLEKEQPIIKASQMVHHEPELQELLRDGKNPHDERYLHALCNDCHLSELREKKNGENFRSL